MKNTTTAKKKELAKLLNYPEVKSWRTLMYSFKAIFSQLEKGLMAEGCSVSRFQIMFYLYFEGSMQAIEIAKRLVVTRGNISTFLKRMVADGLIKPSVQKGSKRPEFFLTKKGTTFFEKILPAHIERVQKYTPSLNNEALKTLNDTI